MVTEEGSGFGSGGWMCEQDMVFESTLALVDLEEGEAVWNNMAGVVEVKKGSGSGSGPGGWTWEQNKAFENALALVDLGEGEAVWNKIADAVWGKTAEEIKRHYELLVADVDAIEAGRVPLPVYTDGGSPEEGGSGGKKGGGRVRGGRGGHGPKGSSKSVEHEGRKGILWTEDEHRFVPPVFVLLSAEERAHVSSTFFTLYLFIEQL